MPNSVTSQRINAVGLASLLLVTAGCIGLGVMPAFAAMLCALAYAVPVAVLELTVLKVHRRASTGLDWDRGLGEADWPRLGVKLLGLAAMLAAVALVHWLVRFYDIEQMALFGTLVLSLSWLIVPVVLIYFAVVDRVMVAPRDGYWHLGSALLGRLAGVDRDLVRELAMGWLVKGFFLPIMVVYLITTHARLQIDVGMVTSGHVLAVRWLTDFVAACELAIVCVGYTLTARALDAQIRSTNPYLMAWLVTLACYEPFNHLVSGRTLAYDDGRYWFDWFAGVPAISWLWSVALLLSFVVWLWATAAFGLRWSNLTNRGIITNGPYRFTKHPDYLSKSIFFWLIHVPFFSLGGPVEALRTSALLVLINVIYFLRARMEEKHLSADPAYVAYALAMNERGLFRGLGRLVPGLRYSPAAS